MHLELCHHFMNWIECMCPCWCECSFMAWSMYIVLLATFCTVNKDVTAFQVWTWQADGVLVETGLAKDWWRSVFLLELLATGYERGLYVSALIDTHLFDVTLDKRMSASVPPLGDVQHFCPALKYERFLWIVSSRHHVNNFLTFWKI